jgi:undecaprenyl-diphosphatase|tara:strand:+ start:4605 stop:5306 length:702 start_codon:yes stop_codon:yes gene_type:complete
MPSLRKIARNLSDTIRQKTSFEPQILACIVAIAGFLVLFGKLVEDVFNQESGAFDKAILLFLRNGNDLAQPIGPAWLLGVVRDITALGGASVLALFTLIVVTYLLVAGHRRAALLVVLSVGLGAVLEEVLKIAFDRVRPDIVPHLVAVHSLSFPSGHAMLSAITYLTLGTLVARTEKQWRVRVFVMSVGVFMTLFIGFGRLYLGVHWPTDVLAGWSLGAAWVLLFWLVTRRFL